MTLYLVLVSKKIKIYPTKKGIQSTGQIGEENTQRGDTDDYVAKKQVNVKKT